MDETFIELNVAEGQRINPLEIETRNEQLPLKGRIVNVSEEWVTGKPKKVTSIEELKQQKKAKEDVLDHKEIKEAMEIANKIMEGMPEEFRDMLSIGRLYEQFACRVKPKDNMHELYLIRFEEGTYFYNHLIEQIVPIRWKGNSFIPVIGIEIKKSESKKILGEIGKLEGFVRYQLARMFHDNSFMTI